MAVAQEIIRLIKLTGYDCDSHGLINDRSFVSFNTVDIFEDLLAKSGIGYRGLHALLYQCSEEHYDRLIKMHNGYCNSLAPLKDSQFRNRVVNLSNINYVPYFVSREKYEARYQEIKRRFNTLKRTGGYCVANYVGRNQCHSGILDEVANKRMPALFLSGAFPSNSPKPESDHHTEFPELFVPWSDYGTWADNEVSRRLIAMSLRDLGKIIPKLIPFARDTEDLTTLAFRGSRKSSKDRVIEKLRRWLFVPDLSWYRLSMLYDVIDELGLFYDFVSQAPAQDVEIEELEDLTDLLDPELGHFADYASGKAGREKQIILTFLTKYQKEIEAFPHWPWLVRALFGNAELPFTEVLTDRRVVPVVLMALKHCKAQVELDLPDLNRDYIRDCYQKLVKAAPLVNLLGHDEGLIVATLSHREALSLRSVIANLIPDTYCSRQTALTTPGVLLTWAKDNRSNKMAIVQAFKNWLVSTEGNRIASDLGFQADKVFPSDTEWLDLYDQLLADTIMDLRVEYNGLDWTVAEFCTGALAVPLAVATKLVDYLNQEEISRDLAPNLGDSHLIGAGVDKLGHRMRLLNYFKA